jgi:excisionase family DNA binding protein
MEPEGLRDRTADVISVREAAHLLRCNVKTIYGAIRRRALPARRLGRRVLICRQALIEWLRSSS